MLAETLSPTLRLALSYASRRARPATEALFAFDQRLAGIVRGSHEPMLAQIRIAWWRELLDQPAQARPAGEPLVAALASWEERAGDLRALADAWEVLAVSETLAEREAEAFAQARASAFASLARLLGHAETHPQALRIARGWALADLAMHLSSPDEREAVHKLAMAQDLSPHGLPRDLRSLSVLAVLATRQLRRGASEAGISPASLLAAMRVGLFGR